MERQRRTPQVGDLWRATAPIPVGTAPRYIPEGTPVMVVGARRNSVDDLEFQVIWGDGAGWVSEHCLLWEAIDAAG